MRLGKAKYVLIAYSVALCFCGCYILAGAWANDVGKQRPATHQRLTAAGTPAQIGAAIARHHGDDIKQLHPTFLAVAMAVCGQDKATLYARAKQIAKHMHADDLAAIAAIADACDLTYDDMLFLNTFYTLTTRHTMACRQVAAWGDLTEDGRLLHARNLDWVDYPGSPLNDHHLILNVEPKDGYRYVLLTWPGLIGAVTGTNEKQITVAFNQLLGGDHVDRLAEPAFFVIRRILQTCDSVDDAVKLLTEAKPLDDGSIMISDAKNKTAAVVEMIDGQLGVRRAEGQFIVNANHRTKEAKVDQPWRVPLGPTDWPAGEVVRSLRKPLDVDAAQGVLADPRVCQSRINIMAVVFDPSNNRMTLSTSRRRAAGGPYVTYPLFPQDQASR